MTKKTFCSKINFMKEKTVLITGASRGIGAECARLFAKNGYNVAFCYNKSIKLAEELYNELLTYSVKVYYEKADVSKAHELKNFIENSIKTFKQIDVLINNAGVDLQKLFIDCNEEDYNYIFDTNFKSMVVASKLVLKNMLNFKAGKIINISSIWGLTGGACEALYSASKAAVIGLTKALSKEYGRMNITVNAIAPGYIQTDMNKNVSKNDAEAFKESTSLNKLGTPQDIAELALFLASEKASYITGQIISVDGGLI